MLVLQVHSTVGLDRPASCLASDGTYLAFACSGESGATLCCPEDIAAAAAAAATASESDGLNGDPPASSGASMQIALRHSAQQRPVTAMCFGSGISPGAAADADAAAAADATWLVTASKDAVLLWNVEAWGLEISH